MSSSRGALKSETEQDGGRLVEVRQQRQAADAAKAARLASAERKVDTRRKIVLGGVVLTLMRSNAQFLDLLKQYLPPMATERDRQMLARLFDGIGNQP